MGRYDGKILLSDMDGTLLDSKSRISENNKQAIKTFIQEGGRFGIATGRCLENAETFLDGVEINGYCILTNGGQLYDFNQQKYIKEYGIEKEKIKSFLQKCLAEKQRIGIQIYTKDMCCFISREEYADQNVVRDHHPVKFVSLPDVMAAEWMKILFSGNESDLLWLESQSEYLETRGDVDRVRSGGIAGTPVKYYEFLPVGINKGSMVAELKKYVTDRDTIYAVGDYYNDIDMLKTADVGIAMENAPDEVKGYADMVCTDCDQDAIADVIENIITG